MGNVAHEGDEAEQQRVNWQEDRILADRVGALGGKDAGERMRVREGSHRGAKCQRRIQYCDGASVSPVAPPLDA
jgi:hypothetical protein